MKKYIYLSIGIVILSSVILGMAKQRKPKKMVQELPKKLVFKTAEVGWIKTLDIDTKRDCIYGTVVDNAGNIYVTGQGYNRQTKCDIITIKYSPEGEILWKQRYNGPANGPDKPYAIAVDKDCNVYVTGQSDGGDESFEDIVTIKYDANGNLCWAKRFDGEARDWDCPFAITVDDLGNVYVAGETFHGEDEWENIVVIKYDTDGNEQWVQTYNNTAGNDWDTPTSIFVDKKYNVYVGGRAWSEETDDDFILIKFVQPYTEVVIEEPESAE